MDIKTTPVVAARRRDVKQAEELAGALAKLTGTTKTDAVIDALRERLERLRLARSGGSRPNSTKLLSIVLACRCVMNAARRRSSATMSKDCRADGDRSIGGTRHSAE